MAAVSRTIMLFENGKPRAVKSEDLELFLKEIHITPDGGTSGFRIFYDDGGLDFSNAPFHNVGTINGIDLNNVATDASNAVAAIGTLGQGTNYTAANAAVISSHLAGIDVEVGNNATAAATADGKAVAAQGDATQALADAATADGKAVTAQGDATQALADAAAAQGDATQALADAATADGKAVTAQGDATQALADAATADGKAVTAQADATQALTNASTAQSAADDAQADATQALSDASTAQASATSAQATADAALPKAGGTMSGVIDMNGLAITGLPTPSLATDAVNKAYADAQAAGVRIKASVAVASTGDVTISNPGTDTFDGYLMSNGQRILLKDQTASTENGIYVFNGSGSAMTRALDFDGSPTSEIINGSLVPRVLNGSVGGGYSFIVNSVGTLTNGEHDVGVDSITFTDFSSPSAPLTAGDGIDGTQLSSDIIEVKLDIFSGMSKSASGLKITESDSFSNDLFGLTAKKFAKTNAEPSEIIPLSGIVFISNIGEVQKAKNIIDHSASVLGICRKTGGVAVASSGDFSFSKGMIYNVAGVSEGVIYYLGSNGDISATIPSSSGEHVVQVGVGVDTDRLMFDPRYIIENV